MIQVKQQLDPIFETYSLLYIAHQKEHYFNMLENSLNALGLQGHEIINSKTFDILHTYIDTFAKYQVMPKEPSLFYKSKDERAFIILLDFVNDIENVMKSSDQSLSHLNETYVIKKLIPWFARISTTNHEKKENPDFNTFLEYVMDSAIDDSAKWAFVSLAKNPETFFKNVILSIHENMPAFEKAVQRIKPELDILLQEFVSSLEEKKEERLVNRLSLSTDSDLTIYPTLSVCGSLMKFHHLYYGLFYDKFLIGNDIHSSNKNDLLMKTKALSDKSKLDILLSLREKPMYSLELAEAMSLSPSTTSHHMNLLVTSGLVTIKKHGGKSYYHINEEGIQALKEMLDYFFTPRDKI